jgi:hypothetical protein
MENNIRVLNKKHLRGPAGNAVYVGRPSVWGNPFVIGKDGSRAEVIEKYETWLMSQPQLLSKLHDLRGKNLVLLVRAAGLSCRRAAAACE